MSNKKIFLTALWISVAAAIAFTIAASATLSANTKKEYTNLVKFSAQIESYNESFVESFKSKRADLSEYRPTNEWNLKQMRNEAADSLRGLRNATIALFLLGVILSIVINKNTKEQQNG